MNTFRAYVNEQRWHYVQVRVSADRKQMHKDMKSTGHAWSDLDSARHIAGQCSGVAEYDKAGKLTGKIAVMFLNVADLHKNPSEIIAHECTHAAMRHATNRKVDLSVMEGEEVLCYAVGHLTREIVNRCHKLKIFK